MPVLISPAWLSHVPTQNCGRPNPETTPFIMIREYSKGIRLSPSYIPRLLKLAIGVFARVVAIPTVRGVPIGYLVRIPISMAESTSHGPVRSSELCTDNRCIYIGFQSFISLRRYPSP